MSFQLVHLLKSKDNGSELELGEIRVGGEDTVVVYTFMNFIVPTLNPVIPLYVSPVASVTLPYVSAPALKSQLLPRYFSFQAGEDLY